MLSSVSKCVASVVSGAKALETLPAPSAASTLFARLRSTGPGDGNRGNITGFSRRKAERLAMTFGTSGISNGQQQVTLLQTSTVASHSA